MADFTYIWTHESWLYVTVVLDLYSRRAVGWSMHQAMTTELVTDALMMAVWRRSPRAALLNHSDQGSLPGFNWSSQHRRLNVNIAAGRVPQRVCASRASFVVWSSA